MTESEARSHCRLRDKGRCRVPGCAERAHHLHHVIFRSQSKAMQWETSNLMSVCSGHHSLIHAGLLTVTGDADDELSVTGDDFEFTGRAWCGDDI